MSGDGDVLPKVEGAGRKRAISKLVKGMVMDRHEKSPNRPRSLFIASRSRDFTVPSGIRSVSAISACAFSSKNDSSITRSWSSGNTSEGVPDPRFHLRSGNTGIGLRSVVNLKLQINLGRILRRSPFAAAEPIDAQVARNGEYPGSRASTCRIEQLGLGPDCKKGFLRQFVGALLARARALHDVFDARRDVFQPRRERLAIPA